MNVDLVLAHILVVFVAAKFAAELAERVHLPAVVGEIVAGVLIGPSVLNLVGSGDSVLRTLGELGVILLLLEVGLEMDLAELGAVGRASILVATVGVVTPMALGTAAALAIGESFKVSLFLGGALTATSVGITARVFGDLRALATTEARIVLGAAVADDVMGLVVLTVVVRIVTTGSVSLLSVVGIVAVALAFLVVGSLIGVRIAPPLFAAVERFSRASGTLLALALAFALGFAELASAAKLAPIVGAFVAGLALARSHQSEPIRRDLAPVGHLFIPIFFLQIGIDARVESFAHGAVLRDAGVLLLVAIVGKLVSPLGAIGTPGDKRLIGLGMLPRGEVGLIFATIGLENHVLSNDLYAALLLVVLITTLVTPPLLRVRLQQIRKTRAPTASAPMPTDGWVAVAGDDVVLVGTPPDHSALSVALEAATLVADHRPTPALLDWMSAARDAMSTWDRHGTAALLALLERGNARSWRLLSTTGVLDRALPELAEAIRTRQADPLRLDSADVHRWRTIEALASPRGTQVKSEAAKLLHPERLRLAALLVEGLPGHSAKDKIASARRIVKRLDLGAAAEQEVAVLVEDADLLVAHVRSHDAFSEESTLQIASHLDRPETARALYLLSCARVDDETMAERLTQLHDLIQTALANTELTGLDARNLVGRRQAEAQRLLGDNDAARIRVESAPRSYVLSVDSETLARHAELLEPTPRPDHCRVRRVSRSAGGWTVDIAASDRRGLLAAVTGVLAASNLEVVGAVAATWPDGGAISSFAVVGESAPDEAQLVRAIDAAVREPLSSSPLADTTVSFDSSSSPWHTICEVRAPDKPGVLHSITTAFAAAGVLIQSATISGSDGMAVDRFEVVDNSGGKVTATHQQRAIDYLQGGVIATRRGLFRARRLEVRVQGTEPPRVL